MNDQLIAAQNEILRLNGLLRVANTERKDAEKAKWDSKAIESILREQNDELRTDNHRLWDETEGLKRKVIAAQNEIMRLQGFLKIAIVESIKDGLKAKKQMGIPDSALKVMCEAYGEMNRIRARCGVPYGPNGYKSDVTQEYWDSIMERLDAEVVRATGKPAWLNPILFNKEV